jgi:hypothetical protein
VLAKAGCLCIFWFIEACFGEAGAICAPVEALPPDLFSKGFAVSPQTGAQKLLPRFGSDHANCFELGRGFVSLTIDEQCDSGGEGLCMG